jgi:hypothetical protein
MDLGGLPTVAEVAGLSGADLDRALVDLEVARRRVEASYLAVLDRAEQTGRHRHDGHASVRGWMSALADASPVEAHRRMQSMRAVRELPAVAAALAAGTIGVEQVREIAKVHANPRVRELVVDGDERLVDHARKGFVVFSEVLRRWEQFGDPHGAERRHQRAFEARQAVMFERDGVVHLHARCGTGQGAAMLEIFQRQCDAEFLADWDQVRADHGDDAGVGLMARTDAQRRLDAVHHLFVQAVAAAPGSVAPEPLVNIVITQADYEAQLREMAGGDKIAPATTDDVDSHRCDTTTGVEISTRDAVVASMIGQVRRVVIDSAGRVVDLGRRRRFTGAARDAVLMNGRRCMWPGCGRAWSRNQIDHTHDHARGGLTTPANGGPACGRHNRLKSRGYTARRATDGTWHVHRPDGTELTRPATA